MAAFGWNDAVDVTEPQSTDFPTLKASVSLKEFAETHLDRALTGGLICPFCGSGSHANGTPAFTVYADHWACYACAPLPGQSVRTGDVFDLAGVVGGAGDDKAAQYRYVAQWAGIDTGGPGAALPPLPASRGQAAGGPGVAAPAKVAGPSDEERFAAERERHAAIVASSKLDVRPGSPGLAYWQSRGFTPEEVERYGLGWRTDRQGVARGVVPWTAEDGEWRHTDRRADSDPAHKYDAPSAEKVGSMGPFGLAALDDAGGVVWVVEGQVDALSLEAVGARAMACGGSSTREVVRALAERHYPGVVVCALDFDPPAADGSPQKGRKANEELHAALVGAGITCVDAPQYPNDAKDANEALVRDRAALSTYVQEVADDAAAAAASSAEVRWLDACKVFRLVDPADRARDVLELRRELVPVPTGFAQLDKLLGGGLYPGVYTLGAISSMGKTTLMVQLADHIAAAGRPVLFVTVEQSADELVHKSLTRLMWDLSGREPDGVVGSRDLVVRDLRESWSPARRDLLARAVEEHGRISARLRYLEAVGQPGVAQINAAVSAMTEFYGSAPVVFIDYLQLLAPVSERDGDKQAVDKNIMLLRQLARESGTTVFTVSSLNRSSYSGVVDLDSFKESGSIEYSSDVLLALQPAGIADKVKGKGEAATKQAVDDAIAETKRNDVRDVELSVLKQREGAALGSVVFKMHCIQSAFVEADATKAVAGHQSF